MSRRLLTGALIMAAAGCGDAGERAAAELAPPSTPPGSAPAPAAAPGAAAAPDTALFATVRRGPGGRFSVSGETRAAEALELTVEDGHRVLFGPTPLEVDDGHFHLEFVAERSDRAGATTSLYLTSPDGARQWVIALPPDSLQVRFGPS